MAPSADDMHIPPSESIVTMSTSIRSPTKNRRTGNSPSQRSSASDLPSLACDSPFKLAVDNSTSALILRHQFLLWTMLVLVILCTVYLYFAVSLGSLPECKGKWGKDLVSCRGGEGAAEEAIMRHRKLL
eukprot:TRINITY_DN15191_c0_g1_i1.p1 TRINITY_DN15191_c0_g1~~TRINITY_DN15191_c0_g1_i1.p1  ORF type:complete len:129 (-),score=22.22 TRINITY_DN15191_c0_g1_i1:46-432(-)